MYCFKKTRRKNAVDSVEIKKGSKDVLCQHLLLLACNSGINPIKTFQEIKKSYAYNKLSYEDFLKSLILLKMVDMY